MIKMADAQTPLEASLKEYLKHIWPTAFTVHLSPSMTMHQWELIIGSKAIIDAEDILSLLNSKDAKIDLFNIFRWAVERAKPRAVVFNKTEQFVFWCAYHEELVSPEHMTGCQFTRWQGMGEDRTQWIHYHPGCPTCAQVELANHTPLDTPLAAPLDTDAPLD